jgi:lauroyl/myristoyl acyltransferase
MKWIVIHAKRLVVSIARSAECTLPNQLLWWFLIPGACYLTIRQWRIQRSAIQQSREVYSFRQSVTPKAWSTRRWLSEIDANVASFHNWWPDRLGNERWRSCAQIIGEEHLDRALVSGPVILTTVHYSDLRLLLYTLRSRKMTAAFFVQQNSKNACPVRAWIDELADAANGMSDIPAIFETNEVSQAHDFLIGRQRILGVAVDGSIRRAISVSDGDVQISLAPGALLMAKITSAQVIPCIISRIGGFRYAIRFSPPVSHESLVDHEDQKAAMDYMWGELRSVIWGRTEQCLPTLIARLRHSC